MKELTAEEVDTACRALRGEAARVRELMREQRHPQMLDGSRRVCEILDGLVREFETPANTIGTPANLPTRERPT